jgi:hypothetical protein
MIFTIVLWSLLCSATRNNYKLQYVFRMDIYIDYLHNDETTVRVVCLRLFHIERIFHSVCIKYDGNFKTSSW